MTVTFGARLQAAMREFGPLSVGIDPHAQLLEQWGLPDSAAGVREFGRIVLEAAEGAAAAVKPQIAFFERHGSQGIAALEEILGAARDKGILTIMDAKRGDIGSTMQGYAEAFLLPGAPLESDSLTLSPYLGYGSLQPAIDIALEHGKGVFVLALTSNPEGIAVQHSRNSLGTSVAGEIASEAAKGNLAATAGSDVMGSIGLVVGATIGDAARELGVDLAGVNGALLAPGVGAQGAGPAELAEVFGDARSNVLAHQSRGVLSAGPDAGDIHHAIVTAAKAAQTALRA